MRKNIAVIGLGRFGVTLAIELQKMGHNVLAVDKDPKIVQELSAVLDHVIEADITDENTFLQSGIADMDTVVAALGNSLSHTIIIGVLAKEAGIENIFVRVNSPMDIKAVQRLGFSGMIYPERESALKMAHTLTSPNVLDHIELSNDFSFSSIKVPASWVGKSIVELKIRNRFNINIIAIIESGNIFVSPGPDHKFSEDESIYVVASNHDINDFELNL